MSIWEASTLPRFYCESLNTHLCCGLRPVEPKYYNHSDYGQSFVDLPVGDQVLDYSGNSKLSLAQIYLNDRIQDCVPAAIAHIVGLLTGLGRGAAGEKVFTATEITQFYSAASGYNPLDPTSDKGTQLPLALSAWRDLGAVISGGPGPNGSGGGNHRILGWIPVDASDIVTLRKLLFNFGAILIGCYLPRTWIAGLKNNFVWTPGDPDFALRHCIMLYGYNQSGFKVASWGLSGLITDGAMQRNVSPASGGECYVALTKDLVNTTYNVCPNNMRFEAMVDLFTRAGGSIIPEPVAPQSMNIRLTGSFERGGKGSYEIL